MSSKDEVKRMASGETHLKKSKSLVLQFVGIVLLMLCAFFALTAIKLNTAPWDIHWFNNQTLPTSLTNILMALRVEMLSLAFVAVLAVFLMFYNASRKPAPLNRAANTLNADGVSTLHATDTASGKPHLKKSKKAAVEAGHATNSQQAFESQRSDPCDLEKRRNGNLESQLCIASDELDKVRRELLDCREDLEQAKVAKSDFLTNMSHELLTPMNGIVGMTDLLLGGQLPPREMRFANSIAGSSNSLLEIINDLLDFSKLESGMLKIEKARFSIRDCIEDVCSTLALKAHEKNIELMCHIDENVPEIMEGDPHRIHQVINNLVSNAIAFTETGEIVVRMSRSDEDSVESTYQFEVNDTGVGISPEIQAQLFCAFTQQDTSITRIHGGMGLGLAITKELVSMMGGDITFKSRLGEGTCFTFTMQLEAINDDEMVGARRRTMVGAHVLVVDHNATNRTILFHQLTNWGLLVETVENGTEALELLRESFDANHPFDAVLLDLHMPDMSGLELAKRMQADADLKNIKSMLFSSTSMEFEDANMQELGIYMHVRKPVRQSVLHASLLSLMPNQSGLPTTTVTRHSKPKNARVLLVEDNVVNRNVAIEMLEQLGCSVSHAENGETAVGMAESEQYDIIVMDCNMPQMDGYEATRRIKVVGSKNASTPVVALTANATTGSREKCIAAGMDDYVSKPVLTRTLSYMLDKWVAHPINKLDPDVVVQDPPMLFTGERDSDLRTTDVPGEISADSIPITDHEKPIEGRSQDVMESRSGNVTTISAGKVVNETTDDKSAVQSQERINIDAIDTIRAMQRPGKADLLSKIVGAFFTKTPVVIERMVGAANDEDIDCLATEARSLRVSSAYLGAEKMSSLCERIESTATASKPAELNQLVTTLAQEYESVSKELNSIVNAA